MNNFGKIVLVPFPFTDLSGSKVRPAVVISSKNIGDDIIVVFVSSNNKKRGKFDLFVKKSEKNGLKSDSTILVSKIATLEKRVIIGEIGKLSTRDASSLKNKLSLLFSY